MILVAPKIFGLVLAGGRSLRMGQDKALLTYKTKPHALYCAELLKKYCDAVFLSLNDESHPDLKGHPHFIDNIAGVGPLAGIMTAFAHASDNAWLVLACDFPFISNEVFSILFENRRTDMDATAFATGVERRPEPLCCIYEPSIFPFLLASLKTGVYSPKAVLEGSRCHLIHSQTEDSLFNANFPNQRDKALESLAGHRPRRTRNRFL